MRFAKFVLHRKNVQSRLLNNSKVLDNVERQCVAAAGNDDRISVYRNPPGVTDRGNVVVTAPMGLEQRHGTLSRILGSVKL